MGYDVLPRDLERFFREIEPHDGELMYLHERFSGSDPNDAWGDVALAEELEDRGFIECVGERRELFFGPEDGSSEEKGIQYRTGFTITYRGRAALDGASRARAARVVRVVFEIVAFLGSLAAIANLILYLIR